MTAAMHVLLVLLVTGLRYSHCAIEQISMPARIQECFDRTLDKGNLTSLIGEKVLWHCVHGSVWGYEYKKASRTMPKVAMDWIGSLVQRSYRDAEVHRREKRQANVFRRRNLARGRPGRRRPARQLRVRKEYRMLTDAERNLFHRAILLLKADTSIPPNRFDALGRLHELLGERSHDGANFLGWHRLFLLVAENALREKVPSVTIPYWDSTLDGGLTDPRSSIMWSPRFLGNGNGWIRTGPFTGWQTPYGPLIRNYGTGGTMMNWTSIRDTFTRRHLSEISYPHAHPRHNIEDHHGEPHLWVGGHMAPQALAAFDPIFLLHHSFIDLLWELFRRIQRRRGVDPTTDYPNNNTGPPGHGFNDPVGFGNLRNRDALSDVFTSEMYTYQLPPTCTRQRPNCGSRYIHCDGRGSRPKCVSTSVFDIPRREAFNLDRIIEEATRTGLIRTKRALPAQHSTRSNATSLLLSDLVDINSYMNQIQEAAEVKCQPENINDHYVNSFNLNGVPDKKRWSYIPVRVITVHGDIGQELPRTGMTETYTKCKHSLDLPFRIFVETVGLNYQGFYKDITHIQKQIRVSSNLAFVAVRTPGLRSSDIFLSAYDSCGRICRPYCRTGNGNSFKSCAGALRISRQAPFMYGANVSSVSNILWDSDTFGVPNIDENQIFVKIVCDTSPIWPWKG